MNDFSLVEKLKILMNMVMSSPLFLVCFMIGIALLIFYIICLKKEIKFNKWIFIGIWSLLLLMLVIVYNNIVLNILDNLFDSIFMFLYFPNITVYIIILLSSNFFFIYSICNKKIDKKHKIINFIDAITLNLILILIVDTIKSNNIDIYDQISIYTNTYLLVLMQLTTAIFTAWLLLNLLISAYNKLKIYDKKKEKEMPEIIFEEI